jgi:predicted nucleotide-binding protein
MPINRRLSRHSLPHERVGEAFGHTAKPNANKRPFSPQGKKKIDLVPLPYNNMQPTEENLDMKRRIFVGSSTEGISQAHQICELLSKLENTECVLWKTVFEPGFLTFEALESMLLECNAAVFIVTADDEAIIRGKAVKIPRANIMLEFGLVAGRIGRRNIALCVYGDARLPSDLKGLTVISMGQCDTSSDQRNIQLASQEGEEKLRSWSAGLLATANMVPRTEIVHGYTGRWDFNLNLNKWRGLVISKPSFANVKGSFDLFLPASGRVGRGFTHARIFFKLITDKGVHEGEYRSSHAITSALCHTDGSLEFTSEAFVLQKVALSGAAPPELSGIDFAPEPWSSRWRLAPSSEPRTLKGTVGTEEVSLTEGTVKAVKNSELT